MSRLALLSVTLMCVSFTFGMSACGDDGDSGDGAAVLPSGAVAQVGDTTIGKRQLDDQVKALRRAQSGGGDARPSKRQLEQQALAVLLQREWIEQEARKRDIVVTPADARSRWRTAAAEQFKSRKARRRFLGGQTEVDVVAQIRIQMLSEAIEEDIRSDADKPKQAVEEFREGFVGEWGDATTCREGYEAPGCGGS